MVRGRKNRKTSYQTLTNKESWGEDPIRETILPQGDLRAELVSVPNPISFTEALDKVRICVQNIEFYVTELQNKLVFLHESFEQLESIKTPGTQKIYVTRPKTPQQIEVLLRDNKQTIEHIAKQGGNIIFPRRNPPKSANCDTKSKIEPKKKSKKYSSNSSSTS